MPTQEPGPQGRIFQSSQFETDLVAGRRILELISVGWGGTGSNEPLSLDVLLLRVDEGRWHRMFLDAGLVFWEEWGNEEVAEDLDDAVQDDLAGRFGLGGRVLDICLAFPGLPNAASGLHIHLDEGRKLLLAPRDPADIDSGTELRLVQGTVRDTYQELLRAYDERDCYEFPTQDSYDDLWQRARGVQCDLAEKLGCPFDFDDTVQDASFHSEIGLPGGARHGPQPSLRFSNFGSMVSVTIPEVAPSVLSAVRDVLRNHNFIYVPRAVLDVRYEGVLRHDVIESWWVRYFDYQ
jgi:hypothetical protein